MGRTVAHGSQRRFSEALVSVTPNKLTAFIPKMVGLLLNRKDGPVDGLHQFTSSMLFVDVSGFSDAASKLHAMSNDGAELISFHLNKYFSSIIDIIHEHGGDIVLFSGDAIMVSWWQLSDDLTDSNVLLDSQIAIRCAVSLLKNAGSYKIEIDSTDVAEMGLHIGLSQGEVFLSIFGGSAPRSSGRWKYLLHGPPIHHLGLAVDVGKNGQLIISQSIMDKIRNSDTNLSGTWITHSEEDFFLFEGIEGGLSEAITNRIQVSRELETLQPEVDSQLSDVQLISSFTFDTLILSANSAGQLRTVSVVFIRLCKAKSPLESIEKFHETLSEAVAIIQRNLTRVDGILNKVVMDDKGVHCLCLFGIPHHCHTDDAERSVIFALKMSLKLAKLLGHTSIGIGRAVVYCGMTGSSKRAEYTVLGDGVNIAARLMTRPLEQGLDRKKRSLLCAQETVASVRQGRRKLPIVFVPAGDYFMKGKDKPVTCYQVYSESDVKGVTNSVKSEGIPGETDSPVSSSYSSLSSCSSLGSIWSVGSRLSVASGSSSKRCSRFESKGKLTSVMPFASLSAPCSPKSNDGGGFFRNAIKSDLGDSIQRSLEGSEIYCRTEELSIIRSFCESLRPPQLTGRSSGDSPNSEGVCLVIAGGHRSGKSLLLHRAKGLLQHPSGSLTLVCGIENGQNMQFGALQSLTHSLVSGMDSLGTQRSKKELQVLSFVIQHNILLEPSEEQKIMSLDHLLEEIAEIILELLLQQVSTTPILIVDDVHWVDPASLYLLLQLKKFGVSCLFAGRSEVFEAADLQKHLRSAVPSGAHSKGSQTSTDSDLEGVRLPGDVSELFRSNNNSLSTLRYVTRVDLNPFSQKSQTELLTILLNAIPEPSLFDKISEKSGGVPGFIVATLSHLTEENVLSVENGVAVLTDSYSITEQLVHYIPGYEATVYRELDALPAPVEKTLHVCSILGSSFDKVVLKDCLLQLPTTKGNPEGHISHLLSAKLLVRVDNNSREKLAFDHPLSRDAVYLAILSQDRRDLHLMVEKVIGIFAAKSSGFARSRILHLLQSSVLAADIPVEVATAAFEESILEDDYQTAIRILPFIPLGSRPVHIRHYLEAVCFFEMSNYSAAQFCLRKLNSTITEDLNTWYSKEQVKSSLFDCCWKSSAVEEPELSSPGKLSDAASLIHHRVSILSKEIEYMTHGRLDSASKSHFTTRKKVNNGIAKSPISMQISLSKNIDELMSDLIVDRTSNVDHFSILPLIHRPRLSVRLIQKVFQCITAAMFGNKVAIMTSLHYLESNVNGGKHWAMISLQLRSILSRFYVIDKKSPKNDAELQSPASGWLKDEPLVSPTLTNSYVKASDNIILSTLQAVSQTSISDSIEVVMENCDTKSNAALCGIVAMNLCERLTPNPPLLNRAVSVLKKIAEKESLFAPAALLYDAISQPQPQQRELLLKCCSACEAIPQLLEGPIFWKARCVLVSESISDEIIQRLPPNYRPPSSNSEEGHHQMVAQLSREKNSKGFSLREIVDPVVLDMT